MFYVLKSLIGIVVFALMIIWFPFIAILTLLTASSLDEWKSDIKGIYKSMWEEIPYFN